LYAAETDETDTHYAQSEIWQQFGSHVSEVVTVTTFCDYWLATAQLT